MGPEAGFNVALATGVGGSVVGRSARTRDSARPTDDFRPPPSHRGAEIVRGAFGGGSRTGYSTNLKGFVSFSLRLTGFSGLTGLTFSGVD